MALRAASNAHQNPDTQSFAAQYEGGDLCDKQPLCHVNVIKNFINESTVSVLRDVLNPFRYW